ncbi:MAG TPA: biotin-dependent carboxyltransferase family protein [Verrucomicrobiae bacterium]|nr:biotin-dependent carboxyltransferase family protein [Verrucomicrobiae bacterium]
MSALVEILEPGPFALVVDAGRPGRRGEGIAQGGALDALAYAVLNRLLDNAPHDAAIEALGELCVRFDAPVRLALTGAECRAELDGARVDAWSACDVPPGAILRLRAPVAGARAYLGVSGGFDVPLVLGSRSTDCSGGFGGLEGRALRAGDALRVRRRVPFEPGARRRAKPPQWDFARDAFAAEAMPVRLLPCRELASLAADERDRLYEIRSVSPRSDRMGYRLCGARIANDLPEMRSHAVFPGVVQLPPSGEPILLLADAPATGGYPKAGVAIAADLWKVAQLPAGARLRFQPCGDEEAARARAELAAYLHAIS